MLGPDVTVHASSPIMVAWKHDNERVDNTLLWYPPAFSIHCDNYCALGSRDAQFTIFS